VFEEFGLIGQLLRIESRKGLKLMTRQSKLDHTETAGSNPEHQYFVEKCFEIYEACTYHMFCFTMAGFHTIPLK
jgi:hypothetical protein